MTESEVSSILKDIVEGFVQIGENKFLHRDLKLANIFMNDGVAKIADFGFAKKSRYILLYAVPFMKKKGTMLVVLSICRLRL